MVFSSMFFLWAFLPITLIGSRILPQKCSNIFLLICSLLFYAWGEPVYILLMLISIVLNWGLGLLLEYSKYKKFFLTLSVVINLAILGYFKYANLLIGTVNRVVGTEVIAEQNIALPIGISFFTFQAMSYIIDLYRGEYKAQKNVLYLALYISFFPQLIAGPIVRYRDVNEQIEYRELSLAKTTEGIRRFIYGLGKKVLISNALGEVVDSIYAINLDDLTAPLIWASALLYTFQIYYDFSGYSDMAIGLGKLFGFDFAENFNYPYISTSIREFWNRWHISLSTWFKEYLYIPLGGNRKGTLKTYRNLGIVFLLTGLWHGANFNFVLWGIYHGFFSIVERIWIGEWLKKHRVLAHIYTFFVVNLGWVFFRIEGVRSGIKLALKMLLPWTNMNSKYYVWEFVDAHVIFVLICAIAGMGIVQGIANKKGILQKYRNSILETVLLLVVLLLCMMTLATNTYNPFIYFRF